MCNRDFGHEVLISAKNPKGAMVVVVVALDWLAHSGVLYSQLPPLWVVDAHPPPAALVALRLPAPASPPYPGDVARETQHLAVPARTPSPPKQLRLY